jgi:TetR/AcrR family transcriptional regulator, transcriptional repressor for nem operon
MRVCQSKLRLLRTAHELIWRQSYGSVGVDQICEHSHVKKGSFYHFFKSKSELTVAAYEYFWEQGRARLDRIFCAQKDPVERLEAYIDDIRDNQYQYFVANGRVPGCPFASLGSELSAQDESIRRMAQQISECKRRYLETMLRDAMDQGQISRQDPISLAQELHFFIAGSVQEAKISNDVGVLDRMKTGVYRIIGTVSAPAT